MEHTATQVAAIADLFGDRLADGQKAFNEALAKKGRPALKSDAMYVGSNAFRRLLDRKDIDAVLIATPHFLHPEHLDAAVEAGKHIYLEKPVAVDVRGCRSVMHSGRKAAGRLSLAVGFQIRHATPFVGMVERIKRGDIGDIVMGQTYYLAGSPVTNVPAGISAEEKRMRLWGLYRALSGDNILLQGVHVNDIVNWVLGAHPVKATGLCGRKARTDDGDNMSYFLVHYEYPGGVPVSFQSQQFDPGFGDVNERFFGTKGVSESHYSGGVFIKGANEWDSGVTRGAQDKISAEEWEKGAFKSALDDADAMKEKAFIDSITSGKFINEAEQGAESTLTALLGTVAAYRREEVTWEELIAADDAVDPMIDIRKFDK